MTDGLRVRYERGQDVIVDYRGDTHQGVIVDPTVKHGNIMCRILIHPVGNYGDDVDGHLGLYSYVMVNESQVKPHE